MEVTILKENRFFHQGIRGCLVSLINILLALCAVAISAKYQYSEPPACRGMLGAGFPKLFICDDWGGGSPTSSWDRIDFVDVLNGGIRPGGFVIDFLFYVILIWGILVLVRGFVHKSLNSRDLWWGTFITIGFISGLLSALLLFQSSDLYIKDTPVGTPTPVSPSPTPTEALPSTP